MSHWNGSATHSFDPECAICVPPAMPVDQRSDDALIADLRVVIGELERNGGWANATPVLREAADRLATLRARVDLLEGLETATREYMADQHRALGAVTNSPPKCRHGKFGLAVDKA